MIPRLPVFQADIRSFKRFPMGGISSVIAGYRILDAVAHIIQFRFCCHSSGLITAFFKNYRPSRLVCIQVNAASCGQAIAMFKIQKKMILHIAGFTFGIVIAGYAIERLVQLVQDLCFCKLGFYFD